MEKYQSPEQSKAQDKQQQQQTRSPERQTSEAQPALSFLPTQALQAGARIQDLTPEQIEEIASVIGNSALTYLMTGGGEALPLTDFHPTGSSEGEPVNSIRTSRPALFPAPDLKRSGAMPPGAFPLSSLRAQRPQGPTLEEIMAGEA